MIFKIEVELFPATIIVAIGTNDETIRKFLNEEYGDCPEDHSDYAYPEENCLGRTLMWSSGVGIIRLKKKPASIRYKGILAHEIMHIVWFILKRVSVPLSDDTHEVYSYLTGYLTEKIYEEIYSHKKT